MRALPTAASTIVLALACADPGTGDDELGESDGDSETGSDSETGTDTDTGGAVDEQAIVDMALGYADFERINQDAFASAHGLADTVNVWVPSAYAEAYRAIDPDDPEASAELPAEALIIKEHLDADAQPVGLTIMYKAEGFDPERNDWWWANLDLDGTVNDGGMVDYCISCHEPRAQADWLFGVPVDNQP